MTSFEETYTKNSMIEVKQKAECLKLESGRSIHHKLSLILVELPKALRFTWPWGNKAENA
jgi:hypothetical protein